MSDKKQFTGVFTPRAVFKLPLSWFQKYVLSSIIYLDNENGCISSNSNLAEKIQSNKEQVSKAIKALEKTGLIKIERTGPKFNQKRKITVVKTTFYKMSKEHLQNVKKEFNQCQNDISLNVKTTTNIKEEYNKDYNKVNIGEKEPANNFEKEEKNSSVLNDKEEAEETLIGRGGENFGGGQPVALRLYDIFKGNDKTMPALPYEPDFPHLKQIAKSIRQYAETQKKAEGNPYWNVSNDEICELFEITLSNLAPRIKKGYYTLSSLARNIHDYMKEIQEGRHGSSKQDELEKKKAFFKFVSDQDIGI